MLLGNINIAYYLLFMIKYDYLFKSNPWNEILCTSELMVSHLIDYMNWAFKKWSCLFVYDHMVWYSEYSC